MADVEVTYENTLIKSLSATGQAVLHTAGKYCDDDITIDYVKPGGGGSTVLASGTFVGNNSYNFNVGLGTKMALKNFMFVFWAQDESEYAFDTKYKYTLGVFVCEDDLSHLVFESNQGTYDRYYTQSYHSYDINDSGTITNLTAWGGQGASNVFRATSGSNVAMLNGYSNTHFRKFSDHWTFYANQSNSNYLYPNTITYNWKLIYFGNDPANDIVEIT